MYIANYRLETVEFNNEMHSGVKRYRGTNNASYVRMHLHSGSRGAFAANSGVSDRSGITGIPMDHFAHRSPFPGVNFIAISPRLPDVYIYTSRKSKRKRERDRERERE